MVKLPSFDDLKKMGTDLIDATKAINLKEVVEHFKPAAPTDAKTKQLFLDIRTTLQELNKGQQPDQEVLIKKLDQQVAELERIIGTLSSTQTKQESTKPEDKK